jgi:hypothetical protein
MYHIRVDRIERMRHTLRYSRRAATATLAFNTISTQLSPRVIVTMQARAFSHFRDSQSYRALRELLFSAICYRL